MKITYFLAAVMLLLIAVAMSLLRIWDCEADTKALPEKRFRRELACDVAVRRHGVFGVDFVACDRAYIEKMKCGMFSIGAFNVLVLDGLSVVLPPGEPPDACVEANEVQDAARLLEELGVTKDILRGNGLRARFSGLRINGFRLATIDAESNVIPRLAAVRGELSRAGLMLRDCDIIQKGMTNRVGEAVLKTRPRLNVRWYGGQLDL